MYKIPDSVKGFYFRGYLYTSDNKFYVVLFKPVAVGQTHISYNSRPYNIKKAIYDYSKTLKNRNDALKLFGFEYNIY